MYLQQENIIEDKYTKFIAIIHQVCTAFIVSTRKHMLAAEVSVLIKAFL